MTPVTNSWLRFGFAAALLVAAGLFLHAQSQAEDLPPHDDLTSLPLKVGGWTGTPLGISPEVFGVLGPGEFLERNYRRAPDVPPMDLFVAYFPSQRTGDTIHSPRNCLPGAGWTPIEFDRIPLLRPDGQAFPANRYVLAKGADRLFVLYWYQAHGRMVASEYWAKFYLVTDAIWMNRTDGALVRVITPVVHGEGSASAQQRAVDFVRSLLPLLESYIPR
jgi:EpsI family protein